MKTIYRLLIAVTLSTPAFGQDPDTLIVQEEAKITALKFAENINRVPFAARKLTNRGWNMNAQSMAEVLQNSGMAFVQKSQSGGGSPVLRGFEASRVLIQVDGIRMNNAIYRTGHLQNIITVDPNSLQYVDILYGPSSTIYGSDALGGVVNMFTKEPKFAQDNKGGLTGNVGSRYSSAIDEFQVHGDFNIAGKKWASFTSVTSSQFGDVTQGDKRNSKYPDFGKKPFYVNTVSGTDYAVVNPDPNEQIASAYKQVDIIQKISYMPRAGQTHMLNVQFSNTGDVPRYDRLTEVAGNVPRFGDWHYGPQKRLLLAYHFNTDLKKGYFGKLQSILSYQDVEESRHDRRFNNKNINRRWERIKVIGYTLDAMHKKGNSESHAGFDMQLNNLTSTAFAEHIVTGARSAINTRYADGDNNMNYFAVYYQQMYKIKPNLILNAGARFTQVSLRSIFVDKTVFPFPFNSAEQNNSAISGNLGITHNTASSWRLSALLSTGFRAPNFDDLAKVFDSRAGAVVVPNPDLKPEYTYNGEINVGKISEKVNTGASVFYTLFRDAIIVAPNGQPDIIYQGTNSVVLASQNVAKAYLYGGNAYFGYTFNGKTEVSGSITYTYGRFKTDTGNVPLDHIPPVYGRAGIKHREERWNVEAYALFNGWKKIKEYSASGEDNQQYATPDGMPSWVTVNLRTQFFATKGISILAGVENILDRNYRYFASGISAPGRNFIVTLRASF